MLYDQMSNSCVLVSLNVTSISCGAPIRDRRQEYYAVAVGFTIVSGIFIGLRLLQRLIFRSGFYMDDYIIALTFVRDRQQNHRLRVTLTTFYFSQCITITTSSVNIYGSEFDAFQLQQSSV
jgi:hypothetical protein